MKSSVWFLALLGAFAFVTGFGAFEGAVRAEDDEMEEVEEIEEEEVEEIEEVYECSKCEAELPASGWCDGCKLGHVGDKTTSCKSCFAAMKSATGAWCDGCKVGYLGTTKTSCKSCFAAMQSKTGAWCDGCKVGYLGAMKTKCKGCFAAMTAKTGGWCDGCKVGYFHTAKTDCKSCFKAMQATKGGWCDDCEVGRLGAHVTECPDCFKAMQSDGICADCGMRFEKGKAFQAVTFHVHELGGAEGMAKIKAAIAKMPGVRIVSADAGAETFLFELDVAAKATIDKVAALIDELGYETHEGDGSECEEMDDDGDDD